MADSSSPARLPDPSSSEPSFEEVETAARETLVEPVFPLPKLFLTTPEDNEGSPETDSILERLSRPSDTSVDLLEKAGLGRYEVKEVARMARRCLNDGETQLAGLQRLFSIRERLHECTGWINPKAFQELVRPGQSMDKAYKDVCARLGLPREIMNPLIAAGVDLGLSEGLDCELIWEGILFTRVATNKDATDKLLNRLSIVKDALVRVRWWDLVPAWIDVYDFLETAQRAVAGNPDVAELSHSEARELSDLVEIHFDRFEKADIDKAFQKFYMLQRQAPPGEFPGDLMSFLQMLALYVADFPSDDIDVIDFRDDCTDLFEAVQLAKSSPERPLFLVAAEVLALRRAMEDLRYYPISGERHPFWAKSLRGHVEDEGEESLVAFVTEVTWFFQKFGGSIPVENVRTRIRMLLERDAALAPSESTPSYSYESYDYESSEDKLGEFEETLRPPMALSESPSRETPPAKDSKDEDKSTDSSGSFEPEPLDEAGDIVDLLWALTGRRNGPVATWEKDVREAFFDAIDLFEEAMEAREEDLVKATEYMSIKRLIEAETQTIRVTQQQKTVVETKTLEMLLALPLFQNISTADVGTVKWAIDRAFTKENCPGPVLWRFDESDFLWNLLKSLDKLYVGTAKELTNQMSDHAKNARGSF